MPSGSSGVPRHSAVLLFAAAGLALLSIGARWGSRADITYRLGYSPGWCSTAYDADGWAYLDCTYSGTYGYLDHDIEFVPGYAGTARIFIVLAIAAITVGYLAGRRPVAPDRAARAARWLQVGLLAAVVAPLLTGLRLNQGQLCWWAAVALLMLALHQEGRLPFRRPIGPTLNLLS